MRLSIRKRKSIKTDGFTGVITQDGKDITREVLYAAAQHVHMNKMRNDKDIILIGKDGDGLYRMHVERNLPSFSEWATQIEKNKKNVETGANFLEQEILQVVAPLLRDYQKRTEFKVRSVSIEIESMTELDEEPAHIKAGVSVILDDLYEPESDD